MAKYTRIAKHITRSCNIIDEISNQHNLPFKMSDYEVVNISNFFQKESMIAVLKNLDDKRLILNIEIFKSEALVVESPEHISKMIDFFIKKSSNLNDFNEKTLDFSQNTFFDMFYLTLKGATASNTNELILKINSVIKTNFSQKVFKLVKLNLQNNLQASNIAREILRSFSEIQAISLNFKNSHMNRNSFSEFLGIISNIQGLSKLKLDLSRNSRLFQLLKEVTYTHTPIGKIENLTKLSLNFKYTPCSMITITSLHGLLLVNSYTLEDLNLNFNDTNFLDDYLFFLASAFEQLVNLKSLKLNLLNNHVKSQGVVAFSQAISHNIFLEKLSLNFKNNHCDTYGFNELFNSLKSLKRLRVLSMKLGKNNLENSCLVKLSETLNNLKLTVFNLELSNFKISPTGLKSLMFALKSQKNLEKVLINFKDDEYLEEDSLKESNEKENSSPQVISEVMENENIPESESDSEESKSKEINDNIGNIDPRSPKPSCLKLVNNRQAFFSKTVEFKGANKKSMKRNRKTEEIKQQLMTYKIFESVRKLQLNLSNTKMDNREIDILTKSFEYCFLQNLRKLELNLANNKFTGINSEDFFLELENLSNLNHLNINFKHNKLQNKGCIALSNMITKLTNLTYLNLNLKNNSISKDGFTSLCLAISDLSILYFLKINLGWNFISKESVEILPRTFQKLKSLRYLILYFHLNVLESEGLHSFGRSLGKLTPKITHLDLNLSFNSSDVYDIKKIIINLMHLNKLNYFSLNLNDQKIMPLIDYSPIKEFFEKILKNASVFILCLSKSDVKNEFLTAFFQALANNTTKLKQLTFNFNFTSVSLDHRFLENFRIIHLNNLKSLSLDFSGTFEKNSKFGLESLSKMINQTRILEKLQIILRGNTFTIESFFLFNLELGNLKFLRILNLDFSCSNITTEFIRKLTKSLENLTNLSEFFLNLEGTELRELKNVEDLISSLKSSCFSLTKLKLIFKNTFLDYDDQTMINCFLRLNDLKYLKILYLDLEMNLLCLDKTFEILKQNILKLQYLEHFYLNLDLNPLQEKQTPLKNDDLHRILRDKSAFLKYLNINLNVNEYFLNNNLKNDDRRNTNPMLGIYPQLSKMKRLSGIENQKKDSVDGVNKKRLTVLRKISVSDSDVSDGDSIDNIAHIQDKKPKELDIFKPKALNAKKSFKKFIRKHFFNSKQLKYPGKNQSLKFMFSKIKGLALQINHIKKPNFTDIYQTIQFMRHFVWQPLNFIILKFNNVYCPEILEMDISFLLDFSHKIYTQFVIDFPPAYDHRLWARISIINHFDFFSFSIVKNEIPSFHHGVINHFYFSVIFKNCFYFYRQFNNKRDRSRTSSIHWQDEKKSLKTSMLQYTDMILEITPLVSFDFDSFFDKSSHLFSLKTLQILSDNTLLFCKFNENHLKKLIAIFKPEDTQTSKVINHLFRNSLKTLLHLNLIAYILNNNYVSQFLNIKSFEMLINFLKIIKKDRNVLPWKVTKHKITELNLEKNLNICTRTCQDGLLNLLDNYWQSYRLETPSDGSAKEIRNFETEINKFYSGLRIHIKDFSFHHLDDSYQDILLTLLECLPNLRRINLSCLNLNDYFCERFSDLLMKSQGHFLKLEYLDISDNPRITNVGLKFMAVGLEYHRDKYRKKSCKIIELHIKKVSKNIETILLDQGLEIALRRRFISYFKIKSFFCLSCLRTVCNSCHYPIVGSQKHDCKTKRKFETNIHPFCVFKQSQRKLEWYVNILKDPVFIIIIFYFIFSLPVHFTHNCIFCINRLAKKIKQASREFRRLSQKSSSKIRPRKETHNFSFFSIWTNSSMTNNDENCFKYDKRVLAVENMLKSQLILWINASFQLINYFVCFAAPLIFHHYSLIILGLELSVCHFFFIGYCVMCMIYEIYLSNLLIKKLNSNSKKESLIKKFTFHNYKFSLLQTLAYKIGFYLDVYFVMIILRTERLENGFSKYKLYDVTVILFMIYNLIMFLMGVICFNQALRIVATQLCDLKITGIANLMINYHTRLAVLTDFQCLAKILDTFSTKSAIKIKSIYVSQIVISSLLKFVLEDLTLMIAQLCFLFDSQVYNPDLLIVIILFKIITFYTSFFTAMNAKASHFSRERLEMLFMSTEKKFNDSLIVDDPMEISKLRKNNVNEDSVTKAIKFKNLRAKSRRRDIQQLREINGGSRNNLENKRHSSRTSKKWESNYELLWDENMKKTVKSTTQKFEFNKHLSLLEEKDD